MSKYEFCAQQSILIHYEPAALWSNMSNEHTNAGLQTHHHNTVSLLREKCGGDFLLPCLTDSEYYSEYQLEAS